MSKLEQNTTSLDEVLAMVNALPDAGGGGGGGAVETCTVTFRNVYTTRFEAAFTYFNPQTGVYTSVTTTIADDTFENVVKGTLLLYDNGFMAGYGNWILSGCYDGYRIECQGAVVIFELKDDVVTIEWAGE